MNDNQHEEIQEELLLHALHKRHQSLFKQYSKIQLIEMQFKSLRDALLNKSKHGEWQGLRRKLGFIEVESQNLLQQAEGFISQLQKSLKATERQCNKRMEKIQKECLQRDIKIRTMLDEQILLIAQENKTLELSEQELQPFLEVYATFEQKLKNERKAQNQVLLHYKLEIQEFRSQNNKRIKQIKKKHDLEMLQLKDKLKKIEQTYNNKITQLKLRRQKSEQQIIQHIQKKMNSLFSN